MNGLLESRRDYANFWQIFPVTTGAPDDAASRAAFFVLD